MKCIRKRKLLHEPFSLLQVTISGLTSDSPDTDCEMRIHMQVVIVEALPLKNRKWSKQGKKVEAKSV